MNVRMKEPCIDKNFRNCILKEFYSLKYDVVKVASRPGLGQNIY